MSDMKTLQKILQVRENEKKNAELLHSESLQIFEQVATKMYKTLKKKESTVVAYDENIQHIVSMEKMEQFTRYIDQLDQHLIYMQQQVNEARTKMEDKQKRVTEAHIEMKKIEKLLEQRTHRYERIQQNQENAFMDELSMQQFLKGNQGESIV